MNSVRSICNEFYGVDSKKRNFSACRQHSKFHICRLKKLEQWDEAKRFMHQIALDV